MLQKNIVLDNFNVSYFEKHFDGGNKKKTGFFPA